MQQISNMRALCLSVLFRQYGAIQVAKKSKVFTALASVLIVASASGTAFAQSARDYIYIVGSSTVYPFSTVVAERFGRTSDFRTPKVESTGSGGGLKLFCDGVGVQYPDIANSSRAILQSEIDLCAAHGVREVIEVKIGYDGIVIANSVNSPTMELTLRDVFLALAKEVPGATEGQLVTNPHRSWRDVNPDLPATPIEVMGPPPTSGTRDAFVELAMESGCKTTPWIAALATTDATRFKNICHTLREDGAFIEAGENDNLIVQKLQANPRALGIFGFSFLDQNAEKVRAALIDGVQPDFDSIADGRYTVARPLYFYAKKAHVDVIPGLRAFLTEFTSERAWGDYGYLSDRGLIPLPAEERAAVARAVKDLLPLSVARGTSPSAP